MKAQILVLFTMAVTLLKGGIDVQPDRLPSPACPDTEVSTNFPFAFGTPHAGHLRFQLVFEATPSNNVQLAFGRDADENGALDTAETSFHFAWDCGTWRMGGEGDGVLELAPPATTDATKSVVCDLRLRQGRPRTLLLEENGVPIVPAFTNAPPDWLFDDAWDAARLTVRGVDAPEESLRLSLEINGHAIILR